MDNLIFIDNKNLANYIMFKLDKLENGFTEEELNQITEVVIDYDEEEESSLIFLNELLKLKQIKSITIRNGFIYNENYRIFLALPHLTEFVFDQCEFENYDLVSSLKLTSLSFVNCKIENYSFVLLIQSLEELTIINGEIEMAKINMLKNLKYLQLSYSKVVHDVALNIDSIEELYIDNTNIRYFEFLNNLHHLKKVSIDEKQYNYNKDFFHQLMNHLP